MENLEQIKVHAAELHALSATFSVPEAVLLVGNDEGLRYSRRLLLERAGLEVVSLNSSQALQRVAPAFNLALLCRSVSTSDALQIARSLHLGFAATPVLRFAGNSEIASQDFTVVLRYGVPPRLLLDEVNRLLQPEISRSFRLSGEPNA